MDVNKGRSQPQDARPTRRPSPHGYGADDDVSRSLGWNQGIVPACNVHGPFRTMVTARASSLPGCGCAGQLIDVLRFGDQRPTRTHRGPPSSSAGRPPTRSDRSPNRGPWAVRRMAAGGSTSCTLTWSNRGESGGRPAPTSGRSQCWTPIDGLGQHVRQNPGNGRRRALMVRRAKGSGVFAPSVAISQWPRGIRAMVFR